MNLEQRIRRDASRVAGDEQASALLACLAKHLFDPDLDETFMARTCGAPQKVRRRLAATVGPLKTYVTALRMAEAARLVCETDLPIPEVGKKVGYRVVRTFRRAFKERHGLAPGKMRHQTRAERQTRVEQQTRAERQPLDEFQTRAGPAPDPAAAADTFDPVEPDAAEVAQSPTPKALAARLRRRVRLGLEPERTAELRAALRQRYPGLETAVDEAKPHADPAASQPTWPPVPVLLLPTDRDLEIVAALAVFGPLLDLPDYRLRHALLDGVRIASSTAFDALEQLCLAQLRLDPEQAVRLAELRVQLFEIHRELAGETGDEHKILTWTFLARMRMMVGDFSGAERTLGFAWEEAAERTGGSMSPWAEIEVRRAEGMVHMHQGRHAEARRALDRAVALGRGLEPGDGKALNALGERLELASLLAEAEDALPWCDELEAMAEHAAGVTRLLWLGAASYHRGKALAAAGRDSEAEAALHRAAIHIATDRQAAVHVYDLIVLGSFVLHELGRLAGRGGDLDEYASVLRGVRDRYEAIGTQFLRAAAEAELAALCALRGQADEARRWATAAADFLEDLPGHRQAWATARQLRRLAGNGADAPREALEATLASITRDLAQLRWEITGAQLGRAAGAAAAPADRGD